MIEREQWAELYDWARWNGLSPVDFIIQAMEHQGVENRSDEEAIHEACRKFSISRTRYPEEK